MPESQDFERLKKFRQELELNQSRFADLVGVHQVSISQYEKGQVPIPYEVLKILHTSHELDVNWLISGAGKMRTTPISENWRIRGETLGFDEKYLSAIEGKKGDCERLQTENNSLRELVEVLKKSLKDTQTLNEFLKAGIGSKKDN